MGLFRSQLLSVEEMTQLFTCTCCFRMLGEKYFAVSLYLVHLSLHICFMFSALWVVCVYTCGFVSGFFALLSAKTWVSKFFIACALIGKKVAIRVMLSADGLMMYSLQSLLMHISWLSSIPTVWQAHPRMLTVNLPLSRWERRSAGMENISWIWRGMSFAYFGLS